MAQLKNRTNYERQLVSLEEVLQTLQEQESADALIEVTLDYLQTEFDYNLVWIALYERAAKALFGKGGTTPTGDASFLKQRFPLAPGDLLDQVLVQQRPAGVPDLREEIRAGAWRQAAQKFNIQGTIIFPIPHKDQSFGLALLGSHLWGGSPRSDETARLTMILRALGAGLYQVEATTQRQQTKRPDEPLLAVLAKLGTLPDLTQRLEAVVQQTHQFILPSRTGIYWFETQRRYFWRRVGNQPKVTPLREQRPATFEIAAHNISGFYQALISDQIVSISEAQSNLKTEITNWLMQQLKAQSLLAAPILFQNELLGFLAVEGSDPRVWSEAEKNYLRGAAQLVALSAPLERMEKVIQQTQQDQALLSGLTRAIYRDEDWQGLVKQCADNLCKRLQVERFLVLLHHPDTGKFEVCYQNQIPHRRPIEDLNALSTVDRQMLERSSEAIALEDLQDDLKLLAWREELLSLGVRSLLACSTSCGRLLEGVIVIGHEARRTWNAQECQIFQGVSQQLGLILHQWQLQRQSDQQQQIYTTTQQAVQAVQTAQTLEQLEQLALQAITQILQVPLAALIIWPPGRSQGWMITLPATRKQFALQPQLPISVTTDPLIQVALQAMQARGSQAKHEALLLLSADELAAETRSWLNNPEIGQLAVMALQTVAEHQATGIVLAADQKGRSWSKLQLAAFVTLIRQLAWSHRSLQVTASLKQEKQTLECLNWYKQRRFEDFYRSMASGFKKLNDLITQQGTITPSEAQPMLRQLQQ
ncbi:MAG TPA: GAF domain-containing protein, partial [Candidatus Caenarcaniphilales bacterium]